MRRRPVRAPGRSGGLRVKTRIVIVVAVALTSATLHGGQATEPRTGKVAPLPVATQRQVLDQYCVTCHNSRMKTAGLAFDAVNLADVGSHAEVLEKAVRRIRAGLMPPVGMRRPDAATLTALAEGLEASLDRAAATPNLVAPGLHRLNRTEYATAIRELLGIDIDAASYLPADDSTSGFDNV